MQIIYEDNHIIAVNKKYGEIIQKDKTGDKCLIDFVKEYLKEKYNKPGNVFLGSPHRLDRPTSGVVLFAKTDKALTRLNKMFASNAADKVYLSITDGKLPKDEGELADWLLKNEEQNKSFVVSPDTPGAKNARLRYKFLMASDKYFLYEIHLLTGRHHQIRAQLAKRNVHIKGDLKYGATRPNPDNSICLHAHSISFQHPISGQNLTITAPLYTENPLWAYFDNLLFRH